MPTRSEQIERAKKHIDNAVKTLASIDAKGEPYITDAQAFAQQAGVCIGKQIEVETPDKPEVGPAEKPVAKPPAKKAPAKK